MQVLLVAIILTMLDIAIARYQMNRTSMQQQKHTDEDRSTVR
jgi:hypothetical protein